MEYTVFGNRKVKIPADLAAFFSNNFRPLTDGVLSYIAVAMDVSAADPDDVVQEKLTAGLVEEMELQINVSDWL